MRDNRAFAYIAPKFEHLQHLYILSLAAFILKHEYEAKDVPIIVIQI